MANEAVPSMTTVLENVDRELSGDSNITKYAPPKHRLGISGNAELEHIQGNLRRLLNELLEEQRKLQAYCDNLKLSIETLQRGAG
jgi:hypothetical protein